MGENRHRTHVSRKEEQGVVDVLPVFFYPILMRYIRLVFPGFLSRIFSSNIHNYCHGNLYYVLLLRV